MPTRISRMDMLLTLLSMVADLIRIVPTKDGDHASTVLVLLSLILTLVVSVLLAVPLVLGLC